MARTKPTKAASAHAAVGNTSNAGVKKTDRRTRGTGTGRAALDDTLVIATLPCRTQAAANHSSRP